MTTRDKLHQVVDNLPESDLPVALRLLEGLHCGDGNPFLRALLVTPLDNEAETEEERAAVEEGKEDIRQGRVVSHEEIRREFGV